MADRLCIMKNGSLFLTGAPADIFRHAEALESSGLALPMVTQIMHELNRRGIAVDPGCYTIEQAAEALLAYRKGDPLC